MYERMLDKGNAPTPAQIQDYVGAESFGRLSKLEDYLKAHYSLSEELKFPFGGSYGWGYKYSHKTTHLCYAFFEADAFAVTMQIGDKQVASLEAVLPTMLPKTQALWADRYPCGEKGGWIHFRVLADNELPDIYRLIEVKRKPVKA